MAFRALTALALLAPTFAYAQNNTQSYGESKSHKACAKCLSLILSSGRRDGDSHSDRLELRQYLCRCHDPHRAGDDPDQQRYRYRRRIG